MSDDGVATAQTERSAESTHVSVTAQPHIHIAARGVEVTRRGRCLLHDVSLDIRSGELVAIIGASKTTLLDVLAGLRVPTGGVASYDKAGRPDAHPAPRIGYVPQDDIVHGGLALATTLRYAARLRLPAQTGSATAAAVVDEVLSALSLTAVSATRVDSLSGGERKRASIAVELPDRPSVLFLDEPTSGLDPGTARALVGLLRQLVQGGTTVVLTTHQPADVVLCDSVVVLAAEGNLAFVGTPREACGYFDVAAVDDGYQSLHDESDPAQWSSRWRARRSPLADPSVSGGARHLRRADARIGPFTQWVLLARRNLDVLRHDLPTLAILLGSPAIIVAMFLMLFHPDAFDLAEPSPNTAVMILFWIAFGGFFFGVTYGLPQVCQELAILRRERLGGLGIGAYVLSKIATLLPVLVIVDASLLGVLGRTGRLPAVDAAGWSALLVTLVLTSGSALAVGLLASAAVSAPAQAVLVLPMLCFPQVLFVGAFLPVPVMAAAGRWMSCAMSNRWAFEALGRTAELARLWRDGNSPLGRPLLASYEDTFARPVWVDWAILSGFFLAFLAGVYVVLVVKTRRRRG